MWNEMKKNVVFGCQQTFMFCCLSEYLKFERQTICKVCQSSKEFCYSFCNKSIETENKKVKLS